MTSRMSLTSVSSSPTLQRCASFSRAPPVLFSVPSLPPSTRTSTTMSAFSNCECLAVSLGVFVANSLRFLQDVVLHFIPFTQASNERRYPSHGMAKRRTPSTPPAGRLRLFPSPDSVPTSASASCMGKPANETSLCLVRSIKLSIPNRRDLKPGVLPGSVRSPSAAALCSLSAPSRPCPPQVSGYG
nr:uncharacterized protein LOC127308157 [Lolium perenne]